MITRIASTIIDIVGLWLMVWYCYDRISHWYRDARHAIETREYRMTREARKAAFTLDVTTFFSELVSAGKGITVSTKEDVGAWNHASVVTLAFSDDDRLHGATLIKIMKKVMEHFDNYIGGAYVIEVSAGGAPLHSGGKQDIAKRIYNRWRGELNWTKIERNLLQLSKRKSSWISFKVGRA